MEKKVNVNAVQCGHLMNFSRYTMLIMNWDVFNC